ncbi:MAG: sodium:alanine symporter family protein [Gammaproteobacteria bacterium]|nr:sodium:alanine symporter family protein [Gammaproteobacteria bacterium]
MEGFESVLDVLNSWLGASIWFPYVLLGVGVWFTIYLGVPQFRYFTRAWRILFGKEGDASAPGDTTHFRALTTALSGTVGTGNIGGVAFALFLGGPAALFWMWATAFVGMTTKFVEVTLSHKYRDFDENGEVAGGPMYYMEKRLNMKWLAVIFAVATLFCAIGTGCLPQSNNLAKGLEASFGIPTWTSGLVLAVLLGLVVIGGIKRIAAVASKIVPAMAAFYLIGAIGVIVVNIENIWPSFLSIFSSIFSGSAALGGFLGASFAYAFTHGVNRGIFSNEAGQGSAPIAHASAKADHPIPEGLVSLLEPFIDTLVICTITGLVILSSGAWADKFQNEFTRSDTEILASAYSDANPADVVLLSAHLDRAPPTNDPVKAFTGELNVVDGAIVETNITVIHNRSIAENVEVLKDGELYSGSLIVENGNYITDVDLQGKSLIHSVNLTVEAFKRGLMGDFGQYAVTLSLVLFAFSTALAWSYYGDRAILYLFGARALMPYRLVYCLGSLIVENGNYITDVDLQGKSLIHSVNLTVEAFKRGLMGDFGQYAVTLSLVLFAFSTALAWSYYGDRAILYLFGARALMPYRLVYCLAFLLGSFLATSLIWEIAAVMVVLMALPNLFGISLLSREMKSTVQDFVRPATEEAA